MEGLESTRRIPSDDSMAFQAGKDYNFRNLSKKPYSASWFWTASKGSTVKSRLSVISIPKYPNYLRRQLSLIEERHQAPDFTYTSRYFSWRRTWIIVLWIIMTFHSVTSMSITCSDSTTKVYKILMKRLIKSSSMITKKSRWPIWYCTVPFHSISRSHITWTFRIY